MKSSKKHVAPILAALIASTAIVTTSAPADAAGTDAATKIILGKTAKVLGNNLFSSCFSFGMNIALGELFGTSNSETELSQQSLAAIGGMMQEALYNYSVAQTMNDVDTVLIFSDEYTGDTTSFTSITESKDDVDEIESFSANILSDLNDCGYEVASSYQTIATLRLALMKEEHRLLQAANTLNGTPLYTDALVGIVGSVDGTTRGSIRNRAADNYDDMLAYEADWEAYLADHFLMYKKGASTTKDYYCVKDSSDVQHCGSQFPKSCGMNDFSCLSTISSLQAAAKTTANEMREGIKMLERDLELGESFDDNMDYFAETDDYGIEYCGNGVCALGEIDSCSTDCYAMTTAAAGTVATNGGIDLWSSQARTLLSNSQAHLDWTSTGNLVLYSSSGAVLWSTNLAANTADKLKFQTDGNLVLYGPGGPKWAAGSNATGNRMILVGRELHIVNSSNTSIWSSNRIYRSGTIGNSQDIVLAYSNQAFLLWQADGNLAVYRTNNTMAWGSGTNGQGTQIVISGGTITIKNSSGATVWSNFGSVSRPNSYIELVGDLLRTRTTSGGYSTWSSGSCTLAACKNDRNDIEDGIKYCFDTDQAHTLMSNDDAKLNWQSDGNLVIVNASGSARWATGTGGYIGRYVCFQADGNLVIYDSSWNAKWAASNTSSAVFGATRLSLDSCNLSATNSTGKVLFGTSVTCY